jgi:hypothetical protein
MYLYVRLSAAPWPDLAHMLDSAAHISACGVAHCMWINCTYLKQHGEGLWRCNCNKQTNKLHGLSPRANYTDRATAACQRSDCQLFADRGRHVISMTDPFGRILGFLDRSRYFSIKQLLSCTHEAEWTPFQTHYFFSSGSAGNWTRASGSVAKNSDH